MRPISNLKNWRRYCPNEFLGRHRVRHGGDRELSVVPTDLAERLYFSVKRQDLNEVVATNLYVQRAERELLRGLMALEIGNTISARIHFEAVEDAVRQEMALRLPGTVSRFPDHKIAEKYLELMNDQEQRDQQP